MNKYSMIVGPVRCLGLLVLTAVATLGWQSPTAEAKDMWVCLKAHTGKIIQAKQRKNRMFATRDRCGKWQRVKLVDTNGGQLMHMDTIALKTPFGRYVSAQKDDDFTVMVNRRNQKSWETWTIIKINHRHNKVISPGDRVALKSAHDRYLVAESSSGRIVRANRTQLGKWEKFVLVDAKAPEKRLGLRKRGDALKAAVHAFRKKHKILGLAVGVIDINHKGKASPAGIYLSGYTHPDRRQQDQLQWSTPFRWASVSKTLTAVTALQLVENGKLSLKKHVRDYLPEWANSAGLKKPFLNNRRRRSRQNTKIKISELLTNTGGVNHYGAGLRGADGQEARIVPSCERKDAPFLRSLETRWKPKKTLEVFSDCPLIAQPGSAYRYSSYGFNLLGSVVHAAGPGYVKQVDRFIKKRLRLHSLMTSNQHCRQQNARARHPFNQCFKGAQGSGRNQRFIQENGINWKLPSGGWVSNIRDFRGFAMALMTPGKVLKQPKFLWTHTQSSKGSYHYGIKKNGMGPSTYFVEHDGIGPGSRTLMAFFPKLQKGVVIMSNHNTGKDEQIYDLADDLFYLIDAPF